MGKRRVQDIHAFLTWCGVVNNYLAIRMKMAYWVATLLQYRERGILREGEVGSRGNHSEAFMKNY